MSTLTNRRVRHRWHEKLRALLTERRALVVLTELHVANHLHPATGWVHASGVEAPNVNASASPSTTARMTQRG